MGILTTYACDCCGGISQDISKFEPVPVRVNLGTWTAQVDNVLLCKSCTSLLVAAAMTEVSTLQGTKSGVQL